MKGWVYVISNKGKTGMVKVGYSLKDPALRAKELNSTADPYPHVVDYECLTHDPLVVEQQVHVALASNRINSTSSGVGTEWFQVTSQVAANTIKEMAQDKFIDETFHKLDRERVLAERKKREKETIRREEEIIRFEKERKDQDERLRRETIVKEKKANKEKIIKEEQFQSSVIKAKNIVSNERKLCLKHMPNGNYIKYAIYFVLSTAAALIFPSFASNKGGNDPMSVIIAIIFIGIVAWSSAAYMRKNFKAEQADVFYGDRTVNEVANLLFHSKDYRPYLNKIRSKVGAPSIQD